MNHPLYYFLSSSSLPIVSLCDTAHIKPPYLHFKRRSQEYIFYYIRSGRLVIREDKREYDFTAGDYILLDPAFEHEGLLSTTCRFTYLHFTHKSLSLLSNPDRDSSQALLLFPKSGKIHTGELSEELNSLLSRLESVTQQTPEEAFLKSSLACQLFALLAIHDKRSLVRASASRSRSGEYAMALKSYLSSEYGSPINSHSIEAAFHCNFDYLNRCFKREAGDTIFSALTRIRIENAQKYLATGLFTCSETASKCGFHDIYYFSRVFKKHVGLSPRAYQKNMLL